MPAIVPCPSCEKKLKVPDGAEGKKIRCPHCKTLLLISTDGLDLAEGVTAAKPAKRRPAEEDEDDRPVRRRGRDDDDEDDRPRARRRDDDDDEDDRPRRRKKGGFFSRIPKWGWYAGGGGIAALVLILVLVLVLGGGGSKLDKVKEGMTEKEVTDLLGEPTTGDAKMLGFVMYYHPPIAKKDNMDVKKMSDFKEVLKVYYKDGKVSKVKKLTKSQIEKNPMELMP